MIVLTNRIAILSVLLVCSCADPRPPTGGPRDEIPPALLSTEPPHESVEVSPSELKLVFSEYVNEGSFASALSIVPTPQGRLEYRWRRRSVTVRLPEPLRDSTTYVVTLDDEFRDWRGVRLTRPISFAFATGPVIDQGRLRGRVVDHAQGMPVAGLLVLAYSSQETIDQGPAYQTQTDTEGRFAFDYVRESDFFVLGLRDLNRNLKPDPGEWFAVPPVPVIRAMPDTSRRYADWVYTKVDTLGPFIERVRATANQLIEIRFSESVSLQSPAGEPWSIRDSVIHAPIMVHSSYQSESNARLLYLVTDPIQEKTYALFPDPAIKDSSGNTVHLDTIYFRGSARIRTEEPTFAGFFPEGNENPYRLPPWETPQIVFDQPVNEDRLDSLVSVQDSTGTMVNHELQTSNGIRYSLMSLNDPAQIYRVAVQQPDSMHVRFFERLGPRSLGSLSGVTVPAGDSVLVTLTDSDGHVLAVDVPDSEGAFFFNNLPENTYQLHAFIDRNRNGRWDGGWIDPYQAVEPITWSSEALTIRPRWDTALPETLKIGQSILEFPVPSDQ